ncbi:hypothetical protein K438DRAFT_1789386 [Mycena galopus ATCC 62051]|nr:hypothetical protein K438DRAFT_1789386 [Mycena galopus ATCC 62051]
MGVVAVVTTAKILKGDSRDESQQRRRGTVEAYRRPGSDDERTSSVHLGDALFCAVRLGSEAWDGSCGWGKSQRQGREGMEKKHPGRQNEIEHNVPQLSLSCLRARRLAPAHPIPAFLLRDTASGVLKDEKGRMRHTRCLPLECLVGGRSWEEGSHKMPTWLCHGIMIAIGIGH